MNLPRPDWVTDEILKHFKIELEGEALDDIGDCFCNAA